MLTRMKCSFAGMNYLGHAYLSFNHPQIVVGNMISDFVKGKARFGFSGNIQAGITLHRNIDEYTDNHPATKKGKEIFRADYRLYCGAILDVVYDHFLASDESIFTQDELEAFTIVTYDHLEKHSTELPQPFLHLFTYMRSQNWLFNYRFEPGLQRSLQGLVRRSAYLTESETAFRLFREHYQYLKDCYAGFFPDVKQFAKQRMQELLL